MKIKVKYVTVQESEIELNYNTSTMEKAKQALQQYQNWQDNGFNSGAELKTLIVDGDWFKIENGKIVSSTNLNMD